MCWEFTGKGWCGCSKTIRNPGGTFLLIDLVEDKTLSRAFALLLFLTVWASATFYFLRDTAGDEAVAFNQAKAYISAVYGGDIPKKVWDAIYLAEFLHEKLEKGKKIHQSSITNMSLPSSSSVPEGSDDVAVGRLDEQVGMLRRLSGPEVLVLVQPGGRGWVDTADVYVKWISQYANCTHGDSESEQGHPCPPVFPEHWDMELSPTLRTRIVHTLAYCGRNGTVCEDVPPGTQGSGHVSGHVDGHAYGTVEKYDWKDYGGFNDNEHSYNSTKTAKSDFEQYALTGTFSRFIYFYMSAISVCTKWSTTRNMLFFLVTSFVIYQTSELIVMGFAIDSEKHADVRFLPALFATINVVAPALAVASNLYGLVLGVRRLWDGTPKNEWGFHKRKLDAYRRFVSQVALAPASTLRNSIASINTFSPSGVIAAAHNDVDGDHVIGALEGESGWGDDVDHFAIRTRSQSAGYAGASINGGGAAVVHSSFFDAGDRIDDAAETHRRSRAPSAGAILVSPPPSLAPHIEPDVDEHLEIENCTDALLAAKTRVVSDVTTCCTDTFFATCTVPVNRFDFLETSDSFFYPTRLLIAMGLSWLAVILEGVLVFSFFRGAAIVFQLLCKYYLGPRGIVNAQLQKTIYLSIYWGGAGVAVLCLIVMMGVWRLILSNYRKNIMRLRHGIAGNEFEGYNIVNASHYIGYQLAHTALAYVCLSVIMFFFVLFIVLMSVIPALRVKVWRILVYVFYKVVLPSGGIVILRYALKTLMFRGTYGLLRNRAQFVTYDYFMTYLNVVAGFAAAATRVATGLVMQFFWFWRLDVSTYPSNMVKYDAGYAAFASMLIMDHQYNSPIFVMFAELLLTRFRAKLTYDEALAARDHILQHADPDLVAQALAYEKEERELAEKRGISARAAVAMEAGRGSAKVMTSPVDPERVGLLADDYYDRSDEEWVEDSEEDYDDGSRYRSAEPAVDVKHAPPPVLTLPNPTPPPPLPSRAKIRWHVAYTLVRNPMLTQQRKGYLATLKNRTSRRWRLDVGNVVMGM